MESWSLTTVATFKGKINCARYKIITVLRSWESNNKIIIKLQGVPKKGGIRKLGPISNKFSKKISKKMFFKYFFSYLSNSKNFLLHFSYRA